jgi:hypothetical protein
MAKIHNSKERMPTFLSKELAEEWLQDGLSKKRIIELATNQYQQIKWKHLAYRKTFSNW